MLIDSSQIEEYQEKQLAQMHKMRDLGIAFLKKVLTLKLKTLRVSVDFITQTYGINIDVTVYDVLISDNKSYRVYEWQYIPETEQDLDAVFNLIKKDDFSLFGEYEILPNRIIRQKQ